MSDFNDSDLFGNGDGALMGGHDPASHEVSHHEVSHHEVSHHEVNRELERHDDLYSTWRHYDEYEPFAQALPPSGEPLFPTASVQEEWTGPASNSMPSSQSHDLYSFGAAEPQARPNDAPEHEFYMLPTPEDRAPAHHIPAVEPAAEEASGHLHTDPAVGIYPVVIPPFMPSPQVADGEPASTLVPQVSEKEMRFNRHFAALVDLMQHGAWPQALEKLQAMRAEYPNVAALENLLEEAQLKTELMTEWTHKIKGRRLTVGQEWLIRRSLPFMLLFALFVSGLLFYRNFVAPSRQVVAMERANQALIEEATGLLQAGQIDQALELYELVLDRDPDNSAARQGLNEASRLAGLAVTYDIAIRVANSGNLERSLLLLQTIKAKSPSFRDIDARLARVNSLLDAEKAYYQAEKAFAQRRWLDAITYYEQTQLLASDYQAVRVGLQLNAAYYMASQKMMSQWPAAEFGTEQIRTFLRKAQTLHPQDESIRTFLAHLDDFIRGERALADNNLDKTVETWQELYEEQPNFLAGYLAEQLYRAYLTLAAEARGSNPEYAKELYTLAAALPVRDSSEAASQLQSIGAAVPTPQPTPTLQPTVAFMAAASVVAAPPAPVETPTPEPTATPANSYQGWIAFRSTRNGTEQVYVMRADGSDQQLAPEEIRGRLDALYQEQRRASDGRIAFVQSPTGRSDANIYVVGADGLNPMTLTDNNHDEYDPVWSPTQDLIAFVTNQTGNDEIWVMRSNGAEQRQLTYNNWEWDKHPTWSPDGSQIAFYSNRSGQRQIWVMSSDGSNQRNLSNNAYDDWDPVWLR